MRIIPVLDIKDGLVVRARFGDRASYRPIVTPLASSAEPLAVAAGLLALAPFDTFYIADLDGIAGRARCDAVVDAFADAHPRLDLWVDSGLADPAETLAWASRRRARPVLGSESAPNPTTLAALGDRAVLSLDWRGDSFLGPAALETDGELWPRDVIVMTLARVGSGAGPDLERLGAVARRAGPGRRVFAAGGVRDAADCAALAEAGMAGVLVASALHDGRLTAADIAPFSGG